MAELTPTFIFMNTVGHLREDYIDVTIGSADDFVRTRLANVIGATGMNRSGGADQNFELHPNATTGAADSSQGSIRITNGPVAAVFRIRAIGF